MATVTRLEVRPVTPNIGAVVHDIDLAEIDAESVRAELRRALVEFQVLFFRNQNLTPEQHLAVSSAWAALLYFRKLAMRLDKPIEQLTLDDLLHLSLIHI